MIRKLPLLVALSMLGFAPAAFACGPDAKACHDSGACKTACEAPAKDAKAAAADAKVVAAHKDHACFRDAALSIQGMECQNCADKVTKGLKGVAGVHAVAVDLEHGVAHVDYCSKQVKAIDALIGAVKKAGYVATVAEAHDEHHGDHHEGHHEAAPVKAPAAKI
jgi:copper chaperone CopZ